MTGFLTILAKLLDVEPNNIVMITNGVNKNLRVVTHEMDLFARFSPLSLHGRGDLENEVALICALNAAGAPCCELVGVDEKFIAGPFNVDEGEYHVLLNKTIAGKVLTADHENAREFGRSLAKVHRTPVKKSDVPADLVHAVVQVPSPINSVFQQLKQMAAEQARRSEGGAVGICHGDAWLGNAILSQGRAVLFDFEYSRVGSIAYDIATFIWALQSLENKDMQVAVYRGFVEGYRSVHDVVFEEGELKAKVLLKEIHNIEFLSRHIAMSREIEVATAEFAKATCALVSGDEFLKFRWH